MGLAVALLVAATAGFLLGSRGPWAQHGPRVHDGIAMRANDENDLGLFDAEDGTQATLDLDSLPWSNGSRHGQHDPPCLAEPLEKVRVQVGILRIQDPDGGWFDSAVWLRCPG